MNAGSKPDPSTPTVLHVIPALRTGGAEHALVKLVSARRAAPFPQAVVDLSSNGELTGMIRSAGVPVYEFGMRTPASLPIALMKLARLIRELRPAAIQSWLYYADLFALWGLELSGRRDVTRLYWGIRCSYLEPDSQKRILRWSIGASAARSGRPDAVVANSFEGRESHRRLGYAPRAFPVIPNGIDTSRFQPDAAERHRVRAQLGIPEHKLLVIHVARVDPMKDHSQLVAAARALPDTHFLAVGHGTEQLEALPNLTALGRRSDVAALFTAADIAISTSAFGEGFPTVVAEAMASGATAVATDVGDARKIVGEFGVIVPPRDPAAMIDALRRLASEPTEARLARAAAARDRIERHFALDRFVAAFDALHLSGQLPEATD